MRRKMRLTKLVVLVMCVLLIALPLVTYAQDEGETPDTSAEVSTEAEDAPGESPQGVGTLVLLVGLASVALVGLAMIARDNYQNQDEAPI